MSFKTTAKLILEVLSGMATAEADMYVQKAQREREIDELLAERRKKAGE